MALALNPRAERLLARLPRVTVYTAVELLLLVLLAVQCARLFWAVLTPVGPLGQFRSLSAAAPAPSLASLGGFDPFFRQAPGQQGPAQAVVTSLNIRLFGTSQNNATGGGTAIIAGPDGAQRSIAVGEEIMPGVTLAGVAFDHVTISRGGTEEQLFLDQSTGSGQAAPPQPGTTMQVQPVPPAPPQPPAAAPTPAPPPQAATQRPPPGGNQ